MCYSYHEDVIVIMKKLDKTTKEPHFYSSKDIYFPCEKDARAGVFFVCKEVSLNDEKTEDICG